MKTDENQVEEIIVPLGKALKDARLTASLSLEEVAGKLNLNLSTVRDLEEELDIILETKRYPVIYLRGYLNNYAKLLGLTTLELFVEYKQLDTIQKQTKSLRAPSLIIPPTKKRSKVLPLSLLFILTLLIVFYFFQKQLVNNFSQVNSFSEPITTHSLVVTAPNADVIKRDGIDISDVVSTVEANASLQAETESEVKVDTELQTEVMINSLPESDTDLQAEVKVAAEPADMISGIAKTEGNVVSHESTPIEQGTEQSVADADNESLVISFSGECWTEIFDATGERIAFGLYQNGRVLQLSGIAPFQLKLGDPSVVEIQYKDQIIEGDFAPGRSAQFSVPLS